MGDKLPAIQFYTGDWLKDQVAVCSEAAQGLWLRMLMVMHDAMPYGHLILNGKAMSPEVIARRCGCPMDDIELVHPIAPDKIITRPGYITLLAELDTAGVPRRNNKGIIFSKRMVEDEKRRRLSRKYGKKGGNPTLIGRVIPWGLTLPEEKMKMKLKNSGRGSGGGTNGHGYVSAEERAKQRAAEFFKKREGGEK
jgi:hypothetical protein